MSKAYLILENGTVFEGEQFGYDGEAVGEVVFSTAMTGYLETLSNPSYYGQIVLQTFPLIGNYGVIQDEFGTGAVHLTAYIVREWCQEPSNFRNEGNLDFFLRENKIPGLHGVDTRALTRILRDCGVMNAMISKIAEVGDEKLAKLKSYKVKDAVKAVCSVPVLSTPPAPSVSQISAQESADSETIRTDAAGQVLQSDGNCNLTVALWDFGNTRKLAARFAALGCTVKKIRYDADADEIIKLAPDGVILSGGPGNPEENTEIISQIKKLCGIYAANPSGAAEQSDNANQPNTVNQTGTAKAQSPIKLPILAVGLGHQLLALAMGGKITKLPFGHRGSNQTVTDNKTGRVFVTQQNHGYAVDSSSIASKAEESYRNANDGSCEGLNYKEIPAFSLSFEPTDENLEGFIEAMKGGSENAQK